MIYIDITELAGNPIRTGIQRVVREMLLHWPRERPFTACVFDHAVNGLVVLPEEVLSVLREETSELRASTPTQLRDRISTIRSAESPRRVDPPHGQLLVPELFYDRARCDYYLRRLAIDPRSAHFIIYDFIPWLRPDSIGVEDASPLMHYLRVAQAAGSASFISAATRRDWAERIVRNSARTGPIVPLGADGLGMPKQQFAMDKRTFVSIGSLDGRRNQHLIVRAFKKLWARGFDMPLVLYGYAFDANHPIAAEVIAAARSEPLLSHFGSATDLEVAAGLTSARATIYASSIEGFGLPPVESLWAGIPVIVTADVPSICDLPELGQIRISAPTEEEIERAVLKLADDDVAQRLSAEAASLTLPSWRDFARFVADWVGR
jgi:glycosyltransferase involved in cell wall biosynthesis